MNDSKIDKTPLYPSDLTNRRMTDLLIQAELFNGSLAQMAMAQHMIAEAKKKEADAKVMNARTNRGAAFVVVGAVMVFIACALLKVGV